VAHRECSIAFEVDGPYRAMMLPASNKLGKGGATVKLKKRYAVFNRDRSLAELKGFELKRRGELKLIKIFQSEVFDRFLDGSTLAECYASVAAVADKWLDVLDTRGRDLDDPVLLELITEASTMSKQLGEYGEQKSSRVTTARRLADMLGESAVRDKGLNCSYVIARYPAGAPVSQRAIPVVVFKADDAVRRDRLRRWLQSPALTDYSIRAILDWDYYRGRLEGVVQKLVTLPAYYQGVANPVPRVAHPDWLLRDGGGGGGGQQQQQQQQRLAFKQQSAEERLVAAQRELARLQHEQPPSTANVAVAETKRRRRLLKFDPAQDDVDLAGLTAAPDAHDDYGLWLKWHKRQWRMQRQARAELRKQLGIVVDAQAPSAAAPAPVALPPKLALALHAHPQLVQEWHIVEIVPAVDVTEWQPSGVTVRAAPPGEFTVWAMVDGTMRALRVVVPRRFYVNSRVNDASNDTPTVRLHPPRGHARHQLYEFSMPESGFIANQRSLFNFFASEVIEGVYETGTPLLTRALYELGSMAKVLPDQRWHDHQEEEDDDDDDDDNDDDADDMAAWRQRQRLSFSINQLGAAKESSWPSYLRDGGVERFEQRRAFVYHADGGARGVLALLTASEAHVFLVGQANRDNARRAATQFAHDARLRADAVHFAALRTMDEAFARVNRLLAEREHKRRSALVTKKQRRASRHALDMVAPESDALTVVQSALGVAALRDAMPALHLWPAMAVAASDQDARALAGTRALEAWELTAATLVHKRHALLPQQLDAQLKFARHTAVPLGNVAGDFLRLVADVHLARVLRADGCLLWYSPTDRPDLGGAEADEFQYVDELVNPRVSAPGCYAGVCVELDVIGMAVNTVLEAPHILQEIGATGALTFEGGGGGGGEERPLDSAHAARAAFASLRKLVTRWSVEVAHSDDVLEPLLANFYRWIADTHSLAYDPALHRMLHSLMERVFWRLVERFRKADMQVVYADFNRMIVATARRGSSWRSTACARCSTPSSRTISSPGSIWRRRPPARRTAARGARCSSTTPPTTAACRRRRRRRRADAARAAAAARALEHRRALADDGRRAIRRRALVVRGRRREAVAAQAGGIGGGGASGDDSDDDSGGAPNGGGVVGAVWRRSAAERQRRRHAAARRAVSHAAAAVRERREQRRVDRRQDRVCQGDVRDAVARRRRARGGAPAQADAAAAARRDGVCAARHVRRSVPLADAARRRVRLLLRSARL
jgi:DNA polymerase epsilon subunit 1